MPDSEKDSVLAFTHHDHADCQQHLLQTAQQLCAQRSVRLTTRRLQVLETLLRSHQPMGAYEVLQTLNEIEKNITPPIVYRALEFLQQQGLVHRIESQNAFIACIHPGHDDTAQFLICDKCQRVAELENQQLPAIQQARALGFEAGHAVVEINGLCAACRSNS